MALFVRCAVRFRPTTTMVKSCRWLERVSSGGSVDLNSHSKLVVNRLFYLKYYKRYFKGLTWDVFTGLERASWATLVPMTSQVRESLVEGAIVGRGPMLQAPFGRWWEMGRWVWSAVEITYFLLPWCKFLRLPKSFWISSLRWMRRWMTPLCHSKSGRGMDDMSDTERVDLAV